MASVRSGTEMSCFFVVVVVVLILGLSGEPLTSSTSPQQGETSGAKDPSR